jgi:hypothetical protein
MSARQALYFAKCEDFKKVFVQSECLSVVQHVNSSTTDRYSNGSVIEDIKMLMKSFMSCSFKHIYRGANVVVHSLARLCGFSSRCVSRGVTLECLCEIIYNNIMVMYVINKAHVSLKKKY